MKDKKWFRIAGMLALSLVLGACGGGDDEEDPLLNPLFGPNYNDPFFANCTRPTVGTYNRSVIGRAEASVILELDLIDMPNQTVVGIGKLTIPSIERLDGFNNPWQQYFQSFGQYDPTTGQVPNQNFNGTNTLFSVCVSSVGSPGVLDDADAFEEITLGLRGPGGLYIEMGDDSGYAPPYIAGRKLMGQVYMGLPGHPKDSLTFK